MAVDISSGVNSIIAASGQGQRVAQIAGENNRQDKQRLMGAVSDLGTAYAASKRKEKQLTSLNGVADLAGVPPDSPARGDAQALMLEIKQRHGAMDAQQRADLQAKAQSILMGHEQKMQTQRTEDTLDVDAARDERDRARDLAEGKGIADINAPMVGEYNPQTLGDVFVPPPDVPVDELTAQKRAAIGGYGASAISGAARQRDLARSGQPRPAAQPKWDETPEGYRTKKQIDSEFDRPAKPEETPEQKSARIEAEAAARARGTAAGNPKKPEEMQADAKLRIQDAEYMAGIPPGDRLTYKALAGKDFMKPEEVRELKRITEAANAAWAAKSGGNAPPGAGDAPSSGAKDPASLKARFDAMTPEQQEAFLSKATPEQRAKVGR